MEAVSCLALSLSGVHADLSTGLVSVINGLDSVQVVDSRVETDLVHDCDTSLDDFRLECLHSIRNVAGGNYVLLVSDSGLDDIGMVDVWDQGDDEVVLRHESIEGSFILDVELGNLSLPLKLISQSLSVGSGARGCRISSALVRFRLCVWTDQW